MTVITLGDYGFTISKGKQDGSVAYANIHSVRISRSSGRLYRMHIYPDGQTPIVIGSLSYEKDENEIDHCREYSMLVRVLHHHLKDKSPAVFSCGGSSEKIWIWIIVSVMASFAITMVGRYLGLGLLNPYADALLLSLLFIAFVIVLNLGNIPKSYNPAEIPLHFLP